MSETANARMQQRRGTSATWASLDPVLLAGEFGLETDTGVVKIGDGVKRWSELEALGTGAFVFESEGEAGGSGTSVSGGSFYRYRKLVFFPDANLDAPAGDSDAGVVRYGGVLSASRDMTVRITAAGGGGGQGLPNTNLRAGNGGIVMGYAVELKTGEDLIVSVGKGGGCAETAVGPSDRGGTTLIQIRRTGIARSYDLIKIPGGGRVDNGTSTSSVSKCTLYAPTRDENGILTGTSVIPVSDAGYLAHVTQPTTSSPWGAPLFGHYGAGAKGGANTRPIPGVVILEYDELVTL